jgi:hypothetical protein
MVAFNRSYTRVERTAPEEVPPLDCAIGQQSHRDQLTPPQLLSLMALKTQGSSDSTLLCGEGIVKLSGPTCIQGVKDGGGPVFTATSMRNGEPVGEVYIRERTGAFGKRGAILDSDVPSLMEAIEHKLLNSALTRTTSFVNEYIRPTVRAGTSEDSLAQVGVDLESLRLIMYETGCIDHSEIEQQRNALMRVLGSDSLTAALIVGLGGESSIITELSPPNTQEHVLRSVADAFVVARHGISEECPVSLCELLQNKTTLALVGSSIQKLWRGSPVGVWSAFLPKN